MDLEKRTRVFLNDFFDITRGICVLLVVLGHIRSMLFVNYNELEYTNLFEKLFYLITSQGHYAVVVFFVLSGYLCGGLVIIKINNFSFTKYIINRISRVYVVALPAIFFTLIFDNIGVFFQWSYYVNNVDDIFSLSYVVRENLSFYLLLNNIFLLSGHSYVFGSNTPIWSLSYELWLYISFASIIYLARLTNLIYISLFSFTLIGFFCFVIYFLGSGWLVYSLYWGVGVLAVMTIKLDFDRFFKANYWLYVLIVFWFVILLLFKYLSLNSLFKDLCIALFFYFNIHFFINFKLSNSFVLCIFKSLGKISYSLYLTHFSLGLLLSSFLLMFNDNKKYILDTWGFVCFVLVFLFCIGFSAFIYKVFESQYSKVRCYIYRVFNVNK